LAGFDIPDILEEKWFAEGTELPNSETGKGENVRETRLKPALNLPYRGGEYKTNSETGINLRGRETPSRY